MGTCLGRCLRRSSSGGTRRLRRQRSGATSLVQEESLEFFTLVEDVPVEQKPVPRTRLEIYFNNLYKENDGLQVAGFERLSANEQAIGMFPRKPVLELAEDLWHPVGEGNYYRLNESSSQSRVPVSNSVGDISLQCLDARALLSRGGAREQSVLSSSTPPSSLDLEWEHEGLPSPAPWQILPEEDDLLHFESSSQTSQPQAPQPRCSSEVTNLSGWSRISTPDSLEWDPVQTPLHDPLNTSDLAVSDLDAETEQLLSEIERLTRTALRETGKELHR